MLPSQTQFLGDTGNAEWLTRKARTEDVVRRNLSHAYRVNVSTRTFAKIYFVCFLGVLIPIARPRAPTSSSLKGDSEASDATEQINKSQRPVSGHPVVFGVT
jgi:hypothetical protein